MAPRRGGPLLQATRTVPIVFPVVGDPVGAGFVDSLARPGGNVTGFMHVRIQPERQMAGAAQADRAGRDASGGPSGSATQARDQRNSRVIQAVAPSLGVDVSPVNCAMPARSSAPSRLSRVRRMAA